MMVKPCKFDEAKQETRESRKQVALEKEERGVLFYLLPFFFFFPQQFMDEIGDSRGPMVGAGCIHCQ